MAGTPHLSQPLFIMLAIVIGYHSKDRQAQPRTLYCGRDAGAASEISLAPPPGFIRTEFFKSPAPVRTRHFPALPKAEIPVFAAPAEFPESPEEDTSDPGELPVKLRKK